MTNLQIPESNEKRNLVNQQQNIYIITKSIANEQKKE